MEEREQIRRTGLRTAPRSERASVVESALETIQRLRRKSEESATGTNKSGCSPVHAECVKAPLKYA